MPWYIYEKEYHLCDLYGLECYESIVDDIMSGDSQRQCSDECLDDCEMVIYTSEAATVDRTNPNFKAYCNFEKARMKQIRDQNLNFTLYIAPKSVWPKK